MTLRVIYFITGTNPTVAEQTDIDALNALTPQLGIRSALASSDYGAAVEQADYVSGSPPSEYSGVPVYSPGDVGKILYFIAGSAPTTSEQTEIDAISAVSYEVLVRSFAADHLYGEKIEDVDYKYGTVPTEYAATPDFPFLEQTHVFVLAGQSNMVGRPTFDGGDSYPAGTLQYNQSNTLVAATPPLDHIDEQAGDMGLALQFTIDYAAANPNATVVLVPCADGGTGFSANQWGVGNPLYTALVSRVNQLFTENPDYLLMGILWHQGESDVGFATYQDELDAQFEAFRTNITVATDSTPVILGELLPDWIGTNTSRIAQNNIIADTPNRLAYAAVADSAGLTGFDGTHFDAASLRTFGQRYLAALPVARANAPSAPDAPTSVSVATGDTQLTVSWVAPADDGKSPITDYILERSLGGTNFTTVSDGVSTTTSYVDTGLTNDQEYTYRVSAVNALGTSPASATGAGTPTETPSTAEAGATAHWLFGTDNPTNADQIGALVATGPAHTASAGYITSPSGTMQGLDSNVAEAAEQTTVFVVRKNGGNCIIGGTLTLSGDDGSSGVSPFINGNDARFNNRAGFGNLTASGASEFASTTDFVFVAVSMNATTGDYVAFVGEQTTNQVTSGNASLTTSSRNVGIGNAHYNQATFSNLLDVAECIIFPSALTEAQINDVYQRSRTRITDRGLTIR